MSVFGNACNGTCCDQPIYLKFLPVVTSVTGRCQCRIRVYFVHSSRDMGQMVYNYERAKKMLGCMTKRVRAKGYVRH